MIRNRATPEGRELGDTPTGYVHAIGWAEIEGQQQFQVVVVFSEGPPDLPFSVVWNRTPVAIRVLKEVEDVTNLARLVTPPTTTEREADRP